MIQHVTRLIQPSMLRECVEFYGLLGFQEVDPPAGIAGRAVWLERGGTQIHLMFADDATPERGHVGIVIERYEATLASLRRGGYYVEPRREHWGSPRAYVRDPAGHLVEVMAFRPGTPEQERGRTAR
jgi:catechol 2,3-dioxygenase-like lactoylglutathione lyase family enzyme